MAATIRRDTGTGPVTGTSSLKAGRNANDFPLCQAAMEVQPQKRGPAE
jgi:hypothetical protein